MHCLIIKRIMKPSRYQHQGSNSLANTNLTTLDCCAPSAVLSDSFNNLSDVFRQCAASGMTPTHPRYHDLIRLLEIQQYFVR
mmetsp:Transcript_2455/g.4419  ORF Transcript_2455/g.4419 Transcript_2455/m.4419 type:complete len:82 (+) Transcript_2455:62-307(+)